MQKEKTLVKPFIAVFAALVVLVVVQNLVRENIVLLDVPNNAGVSVLETVGDSLVCVFQNGQTVVWGWNTLPTQKGEFKVLSDRSVILDSEHLAAVSKTGKKVLTVYTLPEGRKLKEISVGWEDQDIRLRISRDKSVLALIRNNPANAAGMFLYEFLTLNIVDELFSPAVTMTLEDDKQVVVDFAVSPDKTVYVVGSKDKSGWIAAVNLQQTKTALDMDYPDAKEFCSIAVSPDGKHLYAGSRGGILYKINAAGGQIVKNIQLLEPGETRPVTNDYSVLNLAFSPDGQYFVATINPKAYLIVAQTDEIVHTCSPADNLVSKIAFSPDNRFFATSDIRASKPIKVWKMPEE
jgi:WD40 repeat protein